MDDRWQLRCPAPEGLVLPVPIDPTGRSGPTRAQAYGPRYRRAAPGLFVPVSTDRGTVEQRILEDSLRLPADGAVSGWAALRLHGGNFFDGGLRGELPVPLVAAHCVKAGPAELHRARLDPSERTRRHGIVCTTPVRATFDAARWEPDLRRRVVVIDMAVAARITTLEEIGTYLDARPGARGVAQVRAALRLANARSRSPRESLMRLVWQLDAGLPPPRCNWPVADLSGQWLADPDLLCEELAVVGEYDGADHRSGRRHRRDVGRLDGFERVGLEAFTVVGKDLDDRELVVRRMHATVRRAAERRRPRQWLVKVDPPPL